MKFILTVFAGLVLCGLSTNASAGEVDRLLTNQPAPQMSYTPQWHDGFCFLFGCSNDYGPDETTREFCRKTPCNGSDDPICSLAGCSACLHEVGGTGLCSGGSTEAISHPPPF